MIKELPIVGLKHSVTKEQKKPITFVTVCVTDCIPKEDAYGEFFSTCIVDGHLEPSAINRTALCSVDKFGRVQDVTL